MMYPYSYTRPSAADRETLVTAEMTLSPKPDQKLLDLLLAALGDEIQGQADYIALSEQAPNKEDAAIAKDIAMDEAKHAQYLKEIYKQLTGSPPPEITPKRPTVNWDKDTLSRLLLGEIEDAEDYRHLYLSFLSREIRDLFFEIMTDEMLHANRLNYLLSKQK